MRITENMRYNATIGNLFNNLSLNNDLTEKIGTQKKVNRASDDPLAATKIVTIRQSLVANEQYTKNINSCQTWLTATESTLDSAYDLLENVEGIVNGAVGAEDSTRQIAAENIQAIIDSLRSLANTKWGDRYLFSGSREGVEPFTATPSLTSTIEAVQEADGNTFAGNVASSGTYTGANNKTYALRIMTAGVCGVATYQASTDGGRTWGSTTLLDATGVVNLGDGVILSFDDLGGTEALGQNDIFYVNADIAGYYRGNDENLSMTINRNTVFEYSISGDEAFIDASGVDIFTTLDALEVALINDDSAEINTQLSSIASAKEQVLLCQSLCGMKANHLDVTKNNLAHFNETLTTLLSDAQDADLTELGAKLKMSETALAASYAMAAKIGKLTILDYI